LREILLHTGQHFDANMSNVFFEELDIPNPDYHLGIGGGTHGQNTGRMIEAIEKVLLNEKPDWLLVYGDTDSTLAGALAAVKLHIPVAHVEAGLRSYNRAMPEEINRVLTDHASEKLFAPTETAVGNLAAEGISGIKVSNVGDVMYDAALYYGDRAEHTSKILDRLGLAPKSYVLATLHRQENVDDRKRVAGILRGFASSDRVIVLPLHPRTRKRLQEFGLDIPAQVKTIDPVGYLDMVMLEKHAAVVATDSGGVQKESYFHKVPCITLRDETEWVELVNVGANHLVGADAGRIASALAAGNECKDWPQLYGNGEAGTMIAGELVGSKPALPSNPV
jgi:UDP-GlcNAc3NAcA epimerase